MCIRDSLDVVVVDRTEKTGSPEGLGRLHDLDDFLEAVEVETFVLFQTGGLQFVCQRRTALRLCRDPRPLRLIGRSPAKLQLFLHFQQALLTTLQACGADTTADALGG